MKRIKSQAELEFVQDVQLLHSISGTYDTLFLRDSINVANCYEKVVEFFCMVQSIAIKGVYLALPLRGWEVWKFKSAARKRAEKSKKIFEESIFRVMSSSHNCAQAEISANNIYFGNPMQSIAEWKLENENKPNPKFQNETRTEIVRFVESFKGRFPLDWISE